MNYFIDVTTIEELKKTFKKLAMKNHPDMGGSTEVMQEINRQYEELLRKLANNKNLNETSDNFYDWTQDKFAEVIQKIIHFTGMTIEVIGEWIWCTNSFQYKDQLKELGFWFAKSKKAWVFNGKAKEFKRGHYSLNQLRRKFATENIQTTEQAKIK